VTAAVLAGVVFALDGESVTGNNTGVAVISAVSIVGGYVLLWGLWYFVFSSKAEQRRKRGRRPRD
jgi:hypothetical protein